MVNMADPSNVYAIDDIKFGTNLSIDVVVASEQAISEAIEKYYSSEVSFDEVMMDFDMDEEDVDFSKNMKKTSTFWTSRNLQVRRRL